jgi:hypothetical protein
MAEFGDEGEEFITMLRALDPCREFLDECLSVVTRPTSRPPSQFRTDERFEIIQMLAVVGPENSARGGG